MPSMKKIYSLSKIRGVTATIGIFDGVHRGHQKILKKLVSDSLRLKTKSLVVTFSPHPRKILNPGSGIPFLTSLEHRFKLIENLGVDFFHIIKLTKPLSLMKPDEFVKKVMIDKFNIKTLVVGRDFLLGNKKKGDFSLLKSLSKIYNFRLVGVSSVKIKKKVVSSTRIRKAIEKGDLKNASLMLGRPVTILGTVVRGEAIGRKIGFPTANINPHHEAIPSSGVYAVDARMGKKIYKAVLNIGIRPTIGKDKEPTIEIHILRFKKNIYGKDIEIIFKRKIRDEKKFSSIEKLRMQIKKDILNAKRTPHI